MDIYLAGLLQAGNLKRDVHKLIDETGGVDHWTFILPVHRIGDG